MDELKAGIVTENDWPSVTLSPQDWNKECQKLRDHLVSTGQKPQGPTSIYRQHLMQPLMNVDPWDTPIMSRETYRNLKGRGLISGPLALPTRNQTQLDLVQ